jgi:hypothetical protein
MSTDQRWKAHQCKIYKNWHILLDGTEVEIVSVKGQLRSRIEKGSNMAMVLGPNAGIEKRATLMASAPELFDALEMLQIATLGYVKRPPVVQTALEVAEAALCKVRGTDVTGIKMDFGRSKHEALIDMLTGLMHANVGFDNALDMARVHYKAEKKL